MRAKYYPACLFYLAVGCAVVAAQTPQNIATAANAPAVTRLPPLPQPTVTYFRELLALRPAELHQAVAGIAGPMRTNLLAKLREYAALAPEERESRLRATELQSYLAPLMTATPTNRVAQLALIPEPYRTMVKERLEQWDALQRDTQRKMLENPWTLYYFLRPRSAFPPKPDDSPSDFRRPLDKRLASWLALPAARRQRMCDLFERFFELSPKEKAKTLKDLSDSERQEMETTLQLFERLPPEQRRNCIASLRKFANMTPDECAEFLKNAWRWKEMSPADRETWRTLVTRLPPPPPGFGEPPLPPGFQKQKPGSAKPPLPPVPLNFTNASQ